MLLHEACLIILLTYIFILKSKIVNFTYSFTFCLRNINVLHYLLFPFAMSWKNMYLKVAVSTRTGLVLSAEAMAGF